MANIGIVGFGTVGSGVYEVLQQNKKLIKKKMQEHITVKYILDVRNFSDHPAAGMFVRDFDVIVQDEDVQIVVEAIGGLEPAYTYVKRALQAGKTVVTSNKELVAEKGAELLELAVENHVCFLFEASVGGGTPIIAPIHQSLAGNEIEEITGIVNGTTNFMLTKMADNGLGFNEALRIAQELGYAETVDPSADVDGIDACRKLAILASIAAGKQIYPSSITTKGIRGITAEDIALLASENAVIKLIAYAKSNGDGLACAVEPMVIFKPHELSGVDDVFNAVLVKGNMTGNVMFYGKGAGKLPTASAIVADMMEAVLFGEKIHNTLYWEKAEMPKEPLQDKADYAYYIRIKADDCAKIDALVNSLFPAAKVIHGENYAIFTPALSLEKVEEALQLFSNAGGKCMNKLKILA